MTLTKDSKIRLTVVLSLLFLYVGMPKGNNVEVDKNFTQNRIEKDNVEYIQTIRSLNEETAALKEELKSLEEKPRDMTTKVKYVSKEFPKELLNLADIVENERIKFGIPVSITFAQAFLESGIRHDTPASKLATEDNNHFGIKWKGVSPYQDKLIKAGLKISKTVERCNKDEKDCAYYIKFESKWDCFRAKSIMITGSRYRHLKGKPFAEFARGLKKGGYATDPKYAKKLVKIIIRYRLYELD
jgi:flagellum-specific peptidoglycan hydrolase FlgJ